MMTSNPPWDESFEKLCELNFSQLQSMALVHRIYFIEMLWKEYKIHDAT